jgi:hypothetical protein
MIRNGYVTVVESVLRHKVSLFELLRGDQMRVAVHFRHRNLQCGFYFLLLETHRIDESSWVNSIYDRHLQRYF